MTKTETAKRFTENDEWDELTSFEMTEVRGSDLREGMMIVDNELGCPIWWLDHRVKAEAPGMVTFMGWREDGEGADRSKFYAVSVGANSKITVAAA